jgi:hypothetical protein
MVDIKKVLKEGEEITEEELKELGWKYSLSYANDLKVYKKDKIFLYFNFKKGTIHRILPEATNQP